jgi:hypothetical protein
MANYEPPTENLPEFNSSVFRTTTQSLTIEDADARYLRFPLGQGTETVPGLVVGGTSNLDGATFEAGVSPAYEIKYPVNSGRFDFYTNTAGGVSTRGAEIDSTGVHTHNHFDTIDEVGGTLNIGTAATRTGAINIGNGATSSRIITINKNGGGNTNINGWTILGSNNTLNASGDIQIDTTGGAGRGLYLGGSVSTGAVQIATASNMSGTIDIGTGNTAGTAGTIGIGNQTGTGGAVNIGSATITVGRSNCASNNIQTSTSGTLNLKTTATGGAINIGNTTGGTITINRPLLPGYTGTTPGATEIGYKADIAGLVFSATSLPAGLANITTSSFSIPNGVWLVNVVLQATLTAGSGNYLRLSLSTTSATIQSARTIDFNPNTNGNNYFNYTTTISAASATNYFLVQDTGTVAASAVSLTINITRIA